MRRAILAIVVTAIGLVLLMSFKPHDVSAVADRPPAVAPGQSGGTTSRADRPGLERDLRGHDDEGDDEDDDGDDDGDEDDDEDDGGLPAASGGAGTSGGGSSGSGSGTAAGSTFTGDAADTRWGPVQVQISVSGGRIAGVQVLRSPDGNHRDIEINRVALPILVQETLDAQSAQIDMVSGATYTSDGYTRSLQSALDRAGL